MRAGFMLPFGLALLVGAATAHAETIAGLPLHVHKFDSGAIRVWVGDHISSTATVAIPTSKGILVIDTTGEPRIDGELRRVIARELGRNDFAMLVNTHEHGDHTGGNSVYADCPIVAHELCAAGMSEQVGDRERRIQWNKERIAELQARIDTLQAASPELPRLKEDLLVEKVQLEGWESDTTPPRLPTRTFSDHLDLELGDTKVELYYIGGMHTSSDIAVLVPKHGLLMTGDTMADVWLTDVPGCLGSFAAHPGVRHDFPRLIRNWNLLLDRKSEVRTLVPGHWNGELSWAGFETRVKYIEALWDGVQRMAKAGAPLDSVQTRFALQTRFPELVNARGCAQPLNRGTIREMWSVATGQQYASDALSAVIRSEPEFREILAKIRAKSPNFYYDEASFNGLAYWLLQIKSEPLAIEVFRLNAELFPQSWNVHDSLAEGLLKTGDRDGAIASYERSVQLNPGNANGKHMLEQIRAGVANPLPLRPGQS